MPLKIKSQTVFATYIILPNINSGELEEKTFMESKVFYNENGKIISSSKYFPSGKPESSLEKKYDEKGNLTEELHFIYGNEATDKKTFRYDDNNLPVAEYLHYADGTFDSTFYIYDENNILLEKKTFDSEKQLELMLEYHYRDKFPSEIISVDADGNILGKEIFKCDAMGNFVERIVIDQDGASEVIQNQFDDSNRLVKSQRKNDFETEATIYKYDENRNIIEEEIHSGGKLNRKTIFMYDENNLLLETSEFFSVPGISSGQKILKKNEYEFY